MSTANLKKVYAESIVPALIKRLRIQILVSGAPAQQLRPVAARRRLEIRFRFAHAVLRWFGV